MPREIAVTYDEIFYVSRIQLLGIKNTYFSIIEFFEFLFGESYVQSVIFRVF